VARDRSSDITLAPVRRLLAGLLVAALILLFLVWRIDSPRVERFRSAVIERVMPAVDWAGSPLTTLARMIDDFQSYARIYEQNQELRRELQSMKTWREAAVLKEQENAKLLALNAVRVNPELTKVTGVVLADSGSPFRQSVLLNVGSRDGILDGWATMDGYGLVGRISGVSRTTSRVILVTDPGSRLPVTVEPSGQRAMMAGDNSLGPYLDFIETSELIRPGDRVVTSGDGGVFPADVLVGQVALGRDGRLRVILAADLQRLDFLKVLRSPPAPEVKDEGGLIRPADAPRPETSAVEGGKTPAPEGSGDG